MNWSCFRFEQLCLITDPVVVQVGGIQLNVVGVDKVCINSLPGTALGSEVLVVQGASKLTNFSAILYHSLF